MSPRAAGVLLMLLAIVPVASTSQINPLDLGKLAPQSEIILVGVVTAVPEVDPVSDTVTVQVVSILKGKTDAKSFSLRLRNKGIKDFDPILVVGDQGVFFLKSLDGGRAELAYWGSVAVVQKKGNFTVAVPPADVTDPFREYTGKEPVPEGLREAYTGFVRATKGGSVSGYLLPSAVRTSQVARPADQRNVGDDINEQFLMNGFSPLVRIVRKEGDDCYLIRTDTTGIGFVQNKSGAWKVYRYSDSPID